MNCLVELIWYQEKVKTVFVMPKGLFKQNRKSFFEFTGLEEDQVRIITSSMTPKQRQLALEDPEAICFIGSFKFFVPKRNGKPSNFEDLMEAQRPYCRGWMIAVDEFHMGYKSIESQQTLCWLHWAENSKIVPRSHLMTGTPIDGRLDTVYPMIRAIDNRYYFNYQDFLNQHATLNDWDKPDPEGWRNIPRVKQIMAKHSVRHTMEEIYGKIPMVIIRDDVEMSVEHRQWYDQYADQATVEMVKDALELGLVVEGFDIAALQAKIINNSQNPGVARLRARQILQCPEVLGIKVKELCKDERILTRAEATVNNGGKFIVFTPFVDEIDRLVKFLNESGLKVAGIHSKMPDRQRDRADEMFKAGELDGVVATAKCCSVGYNWPFVDTVINSAMDYMDSSFVQGYRRAVRGKRDRPLLIYNLHYERSVDILVSLIMQAKADLAAEVNDMEAVQIATRQRKVPKMDLPPGPRTTQKTGQRFGFRSSLS